jgi:riboflavin kinase/FMN adenylyltransferase
VGTALTIGKFDGFHLGHRLLLQDISDYCRKTGAESICYKLEFGGCSILDQNEQERILDSYGIDKLIRIDFTPEFADVLAEDFIRDIIHMQLDAEYVVVGNDFRFGRGRAGDCALLEKLSGKYGYTVKTFDKLIMDGDIVSSTRIRKLIESGSVKEAEELLGSPCMISGVVGAGKQLGRSLGYPTINLDYPSEKIMPRFGVYASKTVIDGKEFSSITNVGRRPSVDDGDAVNAETFIYDFNEDIYGQEVSVMLSGFLRDEKKFSSLDELKEQIGIDIKNAVSYQ